jgi:hypothetical protein
MMFAFVNAYNAIQYTRRSVLRAFVTISASFAQNEFLCVLFVLLQSLCTSNRVLFGICSPVLIQSQACNVTRIFQS